MLLDIDKLPRQLSPYSGLLNSNEILTTPKVDHLPSSLNHRQNYSNIDAYIEKGRTHLYL